MSAPGIFLLTRSSPTIVTSTAIDTTRVGTLVSVGIALSALANFSRVVPLPSLTPNSPPNWPIATWIPTPVRNPMSTLRDRKLAMNPSLRIRAPTRRTAHIRAHSEASSTYWVDSAVAPIATRPVAMIAAEAESAPTTRWRDEPSRAKTATGRRIV